MCDWKKSVRVQVQVRERLRNVPEGVGGGFGAVGNKYLGHGGRVVQFLSGPFGFC